jgi:outer membrane biosynthesis protein TonB
VTPTPVLLGALEALIRGGGSLQVCGTAGTMVHVLRKHLTAAAGSSSSGGCGSSSVQKDECTAAASSGGSSGGGSSSVQKDEGTVAASSSGGGSSSSGIAEGGVSTSTSTKAAPDTAAGSGVAKAISSQELRTGVIQACASLATAAVGHLRASPATGSDLRQLQFYFKELSGVLSCWCGMSVDLLRLAAHEVAAGRAGRATLHLAAAAQQLAAACADKQQEVLLGLAHQAGPISFQELTAAQMFSPAHQASLLMQLAMPGMTYEAMQMREMLTALEQAVSDMQQRWLGVPDATSVAKTVPTSTAAQEQGQLQEEEKEKDQTEQQQQQDEEQQQDQEQQQQQDEQEQQQERQQQQEQERQRQLPPVVAAGSVQLQTTWGLVERLKTSCRQRMPLLGCGAGCKGGGQSNRTCPNKWYSSHERVANCKRVLCGGCKVARYCGRACQAADWPQHRHVCGRLAAAAAAAEAAGAAAEGTAAASTSAVSGSG